MNADSSTTKEKDLEALSQELKENGFVSIPPSIFCLTPIQIDSLRTSFAELFDGQYETGIYPDEIHWRKGISRENATREICNGWKANGTVQQVVCSPVLGELACQLMGWSSSRLAQDDVLHKPPHSGPVGFHQDGAYISDNFVPLANNSLTMWIALDDADEDNGALQYVPGSHLWKQKQQSDLSSLSFHVPEGSDHLRPLRKAAVRAGKDRIEALESLVTVPRQAGQMVVHHQDVWHGSGPNSTSNRHRRALVAHLLNGQVQWREEKPHYIYGRYYIQGERVPRKDFFPFTYSSTATD